jgi:hypothetical protein
VKALLREERGGRKIQTKEAPRPPLLSWLDPLTVLVRDRPLRGV